MFPPENGLSAVEVDNFQNTLIRHKEMNWALTYILKYEERRLCSVMKCVTTCTRLQRAQ